MIRTPLIALALFAATPVAAGPGPADCAALGLENEYLAQLFCSELEALAGLSAPTRSITQDGNPDADSPVSEWDAIGLIQDAYRADPRKTLELIERIKGAGGLPASENH